MESALLLDVGVGVVSAVLLRVELHVVVERDEAGAPVDVQHGRLDVPNVVALRTPQKAFKSGRGWGGGGGG